MNRFGGVLRSEWIKLRSLRSTPWVLAAVVLIEVLVGFGTVTDIGDAGTGANAVSTVVATSGLTLNRLVIVVLGVLVVGSEYSTGQIRTSFLAVPDRVPVLAAKAIVFGAVSFAVGLVALAATALATAPALAAAGQQGELGDPVVWVRLAAGAGYLALSGLVGMGIAAIVRSTALSIALSTGLFLVALTFVPWLPGSAGPQMVLAGGALEPWQALLVMLAWTGGLLAIGAALMRRRDA